MGHADDFAAAFNEFTGGRQFDSLDDLNRALADFTDRSNRARMADFAGLSSEQMHRLLYSPFEGTGDLLTFNAGVDRSLVAATLIAQQVCLVLDYFHQHGPVRATAKGFLGRQAVQQLHAALRQPDDYDYQPRSEEDSGTVHWLRLCLRGVGWLKMAKRQFSLTRKGQRIAEKGMDAEAYLAFLQYYCSRFNWAFRDRCEELNIIQSAFLFALYLAREPTTEFVPVRELADKFLTAFPMAEEECMGGWQDDPWESVGHAFELRFVERFAEPFGLLAIQRTPTDQTWKQLLAYRPTPLYHSLLKWDR
jgi:hypothetical protein